MPLSYKHRTYNRENEISAAALNRSVTKFIYLQTSPRGLDNSQSKLHYEVHKKNNTNTYNDNGKGNDVGSNRIQQSTERRQCAWV